MSEESTRKLEEVLQNVGKDVNAEEFAAEHEGEYKFFHEYFNGYIAAKGLCITEIINKSRISKNYVYNITNGIKKRPGRDKVIALCVAAGMDVEMLNRGLRVAGLNALYPKQKRDVYIAECVNCGKTDVMDVNIWLEGKGESPLDV